MKYPGLPENLSLSGRPYAQGVLIFKAPLCAFLRLSENLYLRGI